MSDNEKIDVKVGDEVFVTVPGSGGRWGKSEVGIKACVTSAARVWLTITECEPREGLRLSREWRMRRDTQTESWTNNTPGGGVYKVHFYTPAQWEIKQRLDAAYAFLREQGINILPESPWYDAAKRIELADLIKYGMR